MGLLCCENHLADADERVDDAVALLHHVVDLLNRWRCPWHRSSPLGLVSPLAIDSQKIVQPPRAFSNLQLLVLVVL